MLRLVHLSDIHFQDNSRAAHLDLDAEVRKRLLVDLGTLVDKIGHCDAVLVVGDIGARGATADYTEATAFLTGVTELVGCGTDRIICVPGNHDVDRGAHHAIHNAIRQQLRTCTPNKINDILADVLQDSGAAAALFKPFDAYNEFALAFGCDISPESPTWTPRTLSLGSRDLVVHGITSAWIADAADDDADDQRRLIAGAFQYVPVRASANDITMTLCHHPLNWLRDRAELEGWATSAHLILSGHEHAFGIDLDDARQWVKIASGAVNPSRADDG